MGESYGNSREETSYPAATQVRVFEVSENRTAGVKSRMIAWLRWGWTRDRRSEWTGNVCGINEVRMRVSEEEIGMKVEIKRDGRRIYGYIDVVVPLGLETVPDSRSSVPE